MKRCLISLLFELCGMVCVFSQGNLREFIVEKDDNPQVFYKGQGCTPNDGVIVFYTTVQDLKFSMPDTPNRLKRVSAFDRENNCYVLCVQPTDTKIGGIMQYSIAITGSSYKPMPAFMVNSITAGVAQYFKIKIEEDWNRTIESLKEEIAKLKEESARIAASQAQRTNQNNNSNNISQNRNFSSSPNYSGPYKYQTTFIDLTFEVPLRESPNVNSREIYKCPKNATIYVIDDNNAAFAKVYVNEYTGYLSKNTLKMYGNSSYSSNNNSTSSNMYQTSFIDSPFEVPLRESPNVNSREIYKCPKNASVYVLDNKGEDFFKVRVNGYIGYVSKKMLKRQW